MNTKQYQKFNFDTIVQGSNKTYSLQFRNGYTYATGLFFYCATSSLAGLNVSLKIDGIEILPVGTDMSLFRWMPGISRHEALWDFSKEAIKCEGKRIEIIIENNGDADFDGEELDLYVLLENQIEE